MPQDFVSAYMWIRLAASSGHESAKEYVEILASEMTKEQIAEAQQLIRDWKPSGGME